MNGRHWFGLLAVAALLGLAGVMIPAVGQEKPKDDKTKPEVKPEQKPEQKPEPKPSSDNPFQWKAFEPDAKPFYQELTTDTHQTMKVMSMPIEQKQKQTFYVSWTPGKKDEKGNWVVTQEIQDVVMSIDIGGNKIEYNSLSSDQPSNPMTDFFNKLRKLKLEYHISPNFTVEEIKGRDAFVKELGGTNPQMEPLLKQILSEDALKQMAEPTWAAVPTKAVKPGEKWEKKSALNLGPIGTYTTDYTYTWNEKKSDKSKQQIDISAKLNYAPPMGKGGAGLPFQILSDSKLESTEGTGKATFDSDKGRIESSDMTMKLNGTLVIEVSGMKTTVELTQTQTATVKTMDTTEWKSSKK